MQGLLLRAREREYRRVREMKETREESDLRGEKKSATWSTSVKCVTKSREIERQTREARK